MLCCNNINIRHKTQIWKLIEKSNILVGSFKVVCVELSKAMILLPTGPLNFDGYSKFS